MRCAPSLRRGFRGNPRCRVRVLRCVSGVQFDGDFAVVSGMRVSYQGLPGAFSHVAAQAVFDPVEALAFPTFEAALRAVENGDADRAMIPVENSVAGRVADVHRLLPRSKLFIVGEHFQPVAHNLLGVAGAGLDTLKTVESHSMALAQCRDLINAHGLVAKEALDTAGAARDVAASGDVTRGALASSIAAKTYGLEIIQPNVQDDPHNVTRFVVMSALPSRPDLRDGPCVSAYLFRVRNTPAALYKVLGGFATNGVNITKLESYMADGDFSATQFYAEVEGHPDEASLARALEEMSFFCTNVRSFGAFVAAPERLASRKGI